MFREAHQALNWAVLILEVLIQFVQLLLTWLLIVAECLWERLYYYGLPPGPWALIVCALIVLRVHEAVHERFGLAKRPMAGLEPATDALRVRSSTN